jgi:NAD(P) transhydrogenase subunit alpha
VNIGAAVEVESGLGTPIHALDSEYEDAGATTSSDAAASRASADIVVRINAPSPEDVARLKRGCIHISFADPFNYPEIVRAFAESGITAISMEMIPRSTIAQKMDALSSQGNLAGYAAVTIAAERIDKILPMMMTPAGTITPSRVFVIGAGVAGLQAIATAKRLGARVDAFDTRPVVEEQVQSLGARFVKVDLGETGQTKDGYATELTPEQLQRQRDAMAKACAQADIVITTAQLFGKKAPVIVTDDIICRMRPGSVIVDLAVATGGNVEGSQLNKEVEVHGVRVIGIANLPGRIPVHASQMYSANIGNLIEHFWDRENHVFRLDLQDEILKGCVLTHAGEVVNDTIKDRVK